VIFTFISEVIQWERWEGTIEYTLMAPVNRWVHLIGQTYYAIIYATLHTILIGSVMVFFFKIDLTHANIWGTPDPDGGQYFADWHRHFGEHPPAIVSRAWCANDAHHPSQFSIGEWRVLSH
jgi:hypothetical protein